MSEVVIGIALRRHDDTSVSGAITTVGAHASVGTVTNSVDVANGANGIDAGSGNRDLTTWWWHEPESLIASTLAEIDAARRSRWCWWDRDTAHLVAELGLAPSRGWDLAAVHRLLRGGWRSEPGRIWAAAHELDTASIPEHRPVDLFSALDDHDPAEPVRADGHLDPAWAAGAWSAEPDRPVRWAALALDVHARQLTQIAAIDDRPAMGSTARSESAASLLAAELEVDGLPFDRSVAERIIDGFVGPRPRNPEEAATAEHRRDEAVRRHVPDGATYDLRSPEQVKSMLRRCGIEVPDTRSWRLERLVDAHPVIAPLLDWRRAERISTTFGYRWIDEHVGPADDAGRARLRGSWTSSDGAAGRMTASAGLHNMPAELRPAVVADPGHRLVRADLGQIEPRVLAAVSGDTDLARAAEADDMYAPVATRLQVERDVAKVAVLGAMYGQTTGIGAAALRGLERAYPVAMGHLRAADEAAQVRRDIRTVGGRLIRFSSSTLDEFGPGESDGATERNDRARAAARGRYGRNAIVQGAAAELFKVWAVLVRLRGRDLGARIVLCLHDELLVHVPEPQAVDAATMVDACLDEAAARWRPPGSPVVRFLADTSIVDRWSDVD